MTQKNETITIKLNDLDEVTCQRLILLAIEKVASPRKCQADPSCSVKMNTAEIQKAEAQELVDLLERKITIHQLQFDRPSPEPTGELIRKDLGEEIEECDYVADSNDRQCHKDSDHEEDLNNLGKCVHCRQTLTTKEPDTNCEHYPISQMNMNCQHCYHPLRTTVDSDDKISFYIDERQPKQKKPGYVDHDKLFDRKPTQDQLCYELKASMSILDSMSSRMPDYQNQLQITMKKIIQLVQVLDIDYHNKKEPKTSQ